MRTGDTVKHLPSGETWVVAWADHVRGEIGWCGWPEGMAKITDCELLESASDDEARELVKQILSGSGRDGSFRRSQVKHLHAEAFGL